jgi:hypothetical protein
MRFLQLPIRKLLSTKTNGVFHFLLKNDKKGSKISGLYIMYLFFFTDKHILFISVILSALFSCLICER